jgi:hypothetical protein
MVVGGRQVPAGVIDHGKAGVADDPGQHDRLNPAAQVLGDEGVAEEVG